MIPFFKYHGTGNDFIMIDERNESFKLSQEKVQQMCSRRFGIGADGLILLRSHAEHDFEMVYHNADGAEGSLCGNGGRCTVKFAHDLNAIADSTNFMAADGVHQASVLPNGDVKLQMSDIEGVLKRDEDFFCDTGSPHVVRFVEDIDEFEVSKEGSTIRNNPYWTKHGGTNVNFVQKMNPKEIKVRTFERGVEAETYSCGTGVTAAALISHQQYDVQSPLKINTLGGELVVYFTASKLKGFTDIALEGPALKVFEGVF